MTAPDSGATPGEPYGTTPAGWPGPAQPIRLPGQLPVIEPADSTPRPVPPGPGVQPPFAAPPVRKEPGTLALSLIVGGVVLLVCLIGGGFILFGSFATALEETDAQARAAAKEYLNAIVDERYADAYRMTCREYRRKVDEQDYVLAKQQDDRLLSYRLQRFSSTAEGDFVVPAKLELASGRSRTVGLVIAWEPAEGSGEGVDQKVRVRVCGEVADPAPEPS